MDLTTGEAALTGLGLRDRQWWMSVVGVSL